MQRLKKTFRLLSLAWLISLASLGVSLGGGVPLSLSRKSESEPPVKTEVVVKRKDLFIQNETKNEEKE